MEWTIVIGGIGAAVSAMAAAAACYFSYKQSKPSCKIKIKKSNETGRFNNIFVVYKTDKIAFLSTEIINTSSQGVTVCKCALELNKNLYFASHKDEVYDGRIIPGMMSDNKMNIKTELLNTPITVKPFDYIDSGFFFPKFIDPSKDKIFVNVLVYLSHKKRPIVYKNIELIKDSRIEQTNK